MEKENKLEQKIREMNLKVGDPVKIIPNNDIKNLYCYGQLISFNYDDQVYYFGGIDSNTSYSIKAHTFLRKDTEAFGNSMRFHRNGIKDIIPLYSIKEIRFPKDFKKYLNEGDIIEIDTLKQAWIKEEGKAIGYYQGIEEPHVLHSSYKTGVPWPLEMEVHDSAEYIPLIKSIKILGEK